MKSLQVHIFSNPTNLPLTEPPSPPLRAYWSYSNPILILLTLTLTLFSPFTATLISATPFAANPAPYNPYNPSPPTRAQALSAHLQTRSSPSPSPRPGSAKRHTEKTLLDRLISENRPAGKMREVGEREGGMRRVWASGKKREGGRR